MQLKTIFIAIFSFMILSFTTISFADGNIKTGNFSSRFYNRTTLLLSGRPIATSVRYHEWKYYKIRTNGKKHLKIYLYNLKTDLDLYVRKSGTPTLTQYDCRPWYGGSSNETCSIDVDRNSEIYIAVYAYSSGNGSFYLKATLTSDNDIKSKPRDIGDVVARDLNVPIAGTLGHLGIWDGQNVMQVMNHPGNVIQKVPFLRFVNESPVSPFYWGARYGKGSYRARRIALQAGWNQRRFNPQYTLLNSYREGSKRKKWKWQGWGWRRVTIITPAKFRCDTFVLYSYRKANVNLYNGSFPSPRIIFFSMPKKRT